MANDPARTWGTTSAERALAFPGDLPGDEHGRALWRGISVAAPAPVVFRWLCQLRAAPYSYDWIDNGGRPSPPALTPGLDALAVGQTVMSIFRLESFEVPVELTLATPPGGRGERLFGPLRCTYWARPETAERTRLLVKLRLPPAQGWLQRVGGAALAWGDLVMMRRQLLNLRRLAESTPMRVS
jgi:hypothetical protein